MVEQYFGTKELYQVTLKANTSMSFGSRKIEEGEPVLYFDKVNIAMLNEQSNPIMARGGWGNMPRVIWEDRSEVIFTLSEGVMNSVSMGLLFSARVLSNGIDDTIIVPKREGPVELNGKQQIILSYPPAKNKKIFCYSYDRSCIQERKEIEVDGKILTVKDGNLSEEYIVDYYFEYGNEALLYLIEKERFNGTFTLEGKFYTKDENDGINVTNVLVMPRVRVVSGINLRLGERADPTVSTFRIIAMPQETEESDDLLMKITRLDQDIDADI